MEAWLADETNPRLSCIARILGIDGKPVGAGFLIDRRLVLTCSHVVAQALGDPQVTPDVPQAEVRLDFPFAARDQVMAARVIEWLPQDDADIAVLNLEIGPPPMAHTADLISIATRDLQSHKFQALGFPKGYDEGQWATGVLLGPRADGWVQIEDVKSTGYRVEQGYSGTPVWDEELKCAVGMVVAADTNPDVKVAYMIPANELARACPKVEPTHIRERPATNAGSRDLLPFMVDRHEQEEALRTALQELNQHSPRPVVCLIHGEDKQCHDMFLERLQRVSLPRFLGLNPRKETVTAYLINEWPSCDNLVDLRAKLEKTLARALADKLQLSLTSTAEEISKGLANRNEPAVIIQWHLPTEDWVKLGSEVVRAFIELWQSWPRFTVGNLLLVVLSIKYRANPKEALWKRFIRRRGLAASNTQMESALSKLLPSQFDGVAVTVLPKLEGIKQSDVENWARMDEVKSLCRMHDAMRNIGGIFKEWWQEKSSSTIPMEELTSRLEERVLPQ